MPRDICNNTEWLDGNLTFNKTEEEIQLYTVKLALYLVATPLIIAFGITGNIFNVITLNSPSLQTVPFMYIRAIAFFDIIGLLCVASFTSRFYWDPGVFAVAFYRAHIELTVLNIFFSSSLYTAVMLTLERYSMISRPTKRKQATNPRFLAIINIAGALTLGALLHLPMAIQWEVRLNHKGTYSNPNHQLTHCPDQFSPIPEIFMYYKQIREAIRIFGVLLMTFLNVIITKKLQTAKKRRRQMTLKAAKRRASNVFNSFTEKRLTGMMIGITILYICGNIPQAGIMIFNSDRYKSLFWFQVYRDLSNFLETLNHCLNFYVFCITSKDYSTTFLQHCLCVKQLLETLLCHPINLRRKNSKETESTSARVDDSPVEMVEDSILLTPKEDLVYL